jgi:hypothetical protein
LTIDSIASIDDRFNRIDWRSIRFCSFSFSRLLSLICILRRCQTESVHWVKNRSDSTKRISFRPFRLFKLLLPSRKDRFLMIFHAPPESWAWCFWHTNESLHWVYNRYDSTKRISIQVVQAAAAIEEGHLGQVRAAAAIEEGQVLDDNLCESWALRPVIIKLDGQCFAFGAVWARNHMLRIIFQNQSLSLSLNFFRMRCNWFRLFSGCKKFWTHWSSFESRNQCNRRIRSAGFHFFFFFAFRS